MNIEIKNLLCARNARACDHTRVYAPAKGSLSSLPCPVVSQNSAFRKTTRDVFPKSSLVFDGVPQVSKFASFSSVKVCISRIVFLPLPSKDTQISALRSAARPLCQRLPYALGIDDTHGAPLCGMAQVDSPSHTWSPEQKGGNAQELAVMSVLSPIGVAIMPAYSKRIRENAS